MWGVKGNQAKQKIESRINTTMVINLIQTVLHTNQKC